MAKATEQGGQVETQREDVRWRVEQLKQSRTRTESQLADARLELGHLEDHSRRLRETLVIYEKTYRDLKTLDGADRQQREQFESELKRVRADIDAAKQKLLDAGHAAAKRTHSFAVVPYEGPNQTRRRPIYLECRADAVVLQPEGIKLRESDFDGPLGPSNPLAVALRAAREYMLAQREFDPQVGEPYPLLLVRPEGINAYYAARMAMKSWGFDFGYELIGDDWKLAFPPSDLRLADVVRQAVSTARTTQARLVAAAPRYYSGQGGATSGTAGGGGVAGGDGASGDDAGYVSAGSAGQYAGTGNGGKGTGVGENGIGNRGPGAAGNSYYGVAGGEGGGAVAITSGRPLRGGGVAGSGNGQQAATGDGTESGNPYRGSAGSGPDTLGATAGLSSNAGNTVGQANRGTRQVGPVDPLVGSGASSASGTVASKGEAIERPEGYVVGQPPREQPTHTETNESASSDGMVRGGIRRPGEWEPTPDLPPEKHEEKNNEKTPKHPPKSPVDQRGADWGLRDVARRSVGVTRPIRVECYADRLVVKSERGLGSDRVVPLGPRTAAAIDPFISAVWEQMEMWGIAGRGMYWRPLLQFYVTPDAESRFTDLSVLLRGSGLLVERK
jgi:hypothetical protein